jgi:enoyl-CoA hydratase/carnithine racemase
MNSSDSSRIVLTGAGAIADARSNRPLVRKTFDRASDSKILNAYQSMHSNSQIRAVVLRGQGISFGVGSGLASLRDGAGDAALVLTECLHEAIRWLCRIGAPVVVRLPGEVAGGCLGPCMACDLPIAAEGARFDFANANARALCRRRFMSPAANA